MLTLLFCFLLGVLEIYKFFAYKVKTNVRHLTASVDNHRVM